MKNYGEIAAKEPTSPRKPKMNLLKRLLGRLTKSTIDRGENQPIGSLGKIYDEPFRSTPLRLNIYRATGGIVVESISYDKHKDRNNSQLHIITHEAEMGEGLSKIITMESLRG